MAGKVLILRWSGSAYDSLGGLLDLVEQEFIALGAGVVVLSADEPEWPQRLLEIILQGDIAFALTMSGIGLDLLADGKLMWEAARIPLFNWNCDHPCYFPLRHGMRNPFLLHGYVFPDHARYNIDHLQANGAAFAVHLGIPPRRLFGGAAPSAAGRNGRIMFTKTGADTNEIEATWRGYAPTMQRIVFAAAEELFGRPTADFLPVVQRVAEPHGLLLDGNNRLTLQIIREIDGYTRFKLGNMVMETLLRYPVDVFGSGWDHLGRGAAGVNGAKFHGPMPWRTMVGRLPDYTGCLSINPLIADSVHDRVFFALAAGVPPITDGNAFTCAHMPGLQQCTFSFTRERIGQAVDAVLSAPEQAIARTEETWHQLSVRFGLRGSVQRIVEFCALHKLNGPGTA